MFMIQRIYRAVAQQFRSFEDTKKMNEHVRLHTFAAGRKLHKNARAVLDVLTRHSCAITGVSWLNLETIADAVGIHVRTVKRAIERLESLGIGKCETIVYEGMELRYFVLQPFSLSVECREFVDKLSVAEREVAPTATRDNGTFSSGEAFESVELYEIKEDDEREYSATQISIVKEAIVNGFESATAKRIALACANISAPVTAIRQAFQALKSRLNNVTLPPITSVPHYFAVALPDVAERLIMRMKAKLAEMRDRADVQASVSGYVPYNWLE
jgi:DNA-binding Lrp family transcriptional regulator